MLGYAGIWVGRFFVLCGLAVAVLTVAVLTVAGFFHAGPWLHLWMAVTNGGALLAGGVWLRRQGTLP